MAQDYVIKTEVKLSLAWRQEVDYEMKNGTQQAASRERAAEGVCWPDDKLDLRY